MRLPEATSMRSRTNVVCAAAATALMVITITESERRIGLTLHLLVRQPTSASPMPVIWASAHARSVTYVKPVFKGCLNHRTPLSGSANERDAEHAAGGRAGGKREGAAVIEQNLARDGEAEAHAVADPARGDVRLEDARLQRRSDSGAAVAHVDEDAIAGAGDGERDVPLTAGGARTVCTEVDEDLSQEIAVGLHHRRSVRRGDAQREVRPGACEHRAELVQQSIN